MLTLEARVDASGVHFTKSCRIYRRDGLSIRGREPGVEVRLCLAEMSPWCRLCIENDERHGSRRFLQKQIRHFVRFTNSKEFWKSDQNLRCFVHFREILGILVF